MSFLASTVLDKASLFLEDPDKARWSNNTLISFLNDGLKRLIVIDTSANPQYTAHPLDMGAKQSISNNALYLLDVLYNTDVTGVVQGKAPLRVKKATLDFTNPKWTQTTKQDTVQFYMYELEDNNTFYVYPPNTGDGFLYIKEAQFLTEVTAPTDSIPLSFEYQLALSYYICFSCFMMDTDTANDAKAERYRSLFLDQLSQLKQSDAGEEQKNAS